MQAVRWWGGWAKNGTVEEIVKSLLEEVEALDSSFSGMFSHDGSCPVRSALVGESSMIAPNTLARESKKQKETTSLEFAETMSDSVGEMKEMTRVGGQNSSAQKFYPSLPSSTPSVPL